MSGETREMTPDEIVAAAEKMDVSEGHAIVIPAMWPRLILERERARIRAALSQPHKAWCSALLGPCDCGHDATAIDDEAKTPQWCDDSGHWIGGNVGMPEAAIDDEAKPTAADLRGLARGMTGGVPAEEYVRGIRDAAIDDEAKGETLHERQVRLNYERPGRAAIDDEAKDVPQGYEPLVEELFVPKRCANCGVLYPRHAAFCKVAAIDDKAKR